MQKETAWNERISEITEKDVKRLWVEKDVNSSEITNRCERLRENSWRTAA